jgi:hypothetical protein
MTAMPQWVSVLTELVAPGRAEQRKRYIPPLDGALLPNDRLQACATVPGPALTAPMDVVPTADGSLLVSTGQEVVRCGPGDLATRRTVARLDGPAGPLAMTPDGDLLVCVGGTGVVRVDSSGQVDPLVTEVDGRALQCPTGVAVAADGTVYVTDGSAAHPPGDWVWDLMEENATGRVIAVDPGSRQGRVLADRLAFPNGVAVAPHSEWLYFTVAWDHSVQRLPISGTGNGNGAPETVRRNMAGYPAQIHPAPDGNYWVALFAMRTQLVEFVLREDEYRQEMMRSIDPDFWVRPALRTLNSGLEPLQGGGIKKLGEMKPWAPPRSYGFVMKMGPEGEPLCSLQSPANGDRHGVWSAREADRRLYIACTGADAVLIAEEGLVQR